MTIHLATVPRAAHQCAFQRAAGPTTTRKAFASMRYSGRPAGRSVAARRGVLSRSREPISATCAYSTADGVAGAARVLRIASRIRTDHHEGVVAGIRIAGWRESQAAKAPRRGGDGRRHAVSRCRKGNDATVRRRTSVQRKPGRMSSMRARLPDELRAIEFDWQQSGWRIAGQRPHRSERRSRSMANGGRREHLVASGARWPAVAAQEHSTAAASVSVSARRRAPIVVRRCRLPASSPSACPHAPPSNRCGSPPIRSVSADADVLLFDTARRCADHVRAAGAAAGQQLGSRSCSKPRQRQGRLARAMVRRGVFHRRRR